MPRRRVWAYERGALWAMDLAAETRHHLPASARAAPKVAAEFGEVGRESAVQVANAMDLRDAGPILRRLATGRRCFVARLNDQIVTYGWVSQRDECVGELERVYRMEMGDAYIWNCATLPAHRGKGLYGGLLYHIVAQLRREGVRRAWIGSSLANKPSLRAFAGAGFFPVVSLIYARLFSLCAMWVTAHGEVSAEVIGVARRMLMAGDERAWGPLAASLRAPVPLPLCAEIEA